MQNIISFQDLLKIAGTYTYIVREVLAPDIVAADANNVGVGAARTLIMSVGAGERIN